MASVLIKNCDWVLTQDEQRRVLKNHSVYIEDGVISEISPRISVDADLVLNGSRKVLMPGLINVHTHIPMTLLRGYADDMELHEWLTQKIWPIESKLTGKLVYYGAMLGLVEMAKTGTTCFLDMYFFMEEVAKATLEVGLRGFLSYGMIDLGDAEKREKELEKTRKFVEHVKSLNSDLVKPVVGPHAPYSCSEELLLRAAELAERYDLLLTIHVAETRKEQAEFERDKGMRVVEYLEKIGFLSRRIVAAHCVWLTKNEMKIMAEKDVRAAHCPVSNMKLAVGGAMPLPELLEYGVKVGLATDGPASNNRLDMFESMKLCSLLHKHAKWDPTVVPAQKSLDLATIDAARALDMEDKIGSVEVGKEADLILVDLSSPWMTPVHQASTVVSHMVYAVQSSDVDTVLVKGRPVVLDKKVVSVDEEEAKRKAQEAALELVSG